MKCECGYIDGNRVTVYCPIHSRQPLTEEEKRKDEELRKEMNKSFIHCSEGPEIPIKKG